MNIIGAAPLPAPQEPQYFSHSILTIPNEVTYKGEVQNQQELDAYRRDLEEIAVYADHLIKDLPAPILAKFNSLRSSMGLLVDTPIYRKLYDMASEIFKCADYDINKLEIGQVRTYFCACNNGKNNSTLYCSVGVGLKDPQRVTQNTTKENIFMASNINNNFRFDKLVTNSPNTGNAIIYIAYDSLDAFPGFNLTELTTLSNLGINNVKLVSKNKYFTENFVPLRELKQRSTQVVPNNNSNQSDSNSILFTWIIVIIFILIIVAILFFIYKRSKN